MLGLHRIVMSTCYWEYAVCTNISLVMFEFLCHWGCSTNTQDHQVELATTLVLGSPTPPGHTRGFPQVLPVHSDCEASPWCSYGWHIASSQRQFRLQARKGCKLKLRTEEEFLAGRWERRAALTSARLLPSLGLHFPSLLLFGTAPSGGHNRRMVWYMTYNVLYMFASRVTLCTSICSFKPFIRELKPIFTKKKHKTKKKHEWKC